MPTFDEFFFISSTGVNRIRVKTCTPDGEVRGVVQIAHGIAEHADRYEDFMRFLAENGVSEKVELGGTFCMGKCQSGVCVTVNDEFHSVTPETVEEFFRDVVLARV